MPTRRPQPVLRVRAAIVAAALTLAVSGPAAAQWSAGPALPAPKAHPAAVVDGDVIRLVGGTPWVGGDEDGSAYAWDGAAWTETAPLDGIGPMIQIGAGLDGLGRVVFTGGRSQINDDLGPTRVYLPDEGTGPSLADPPDLAGTDRFAWTTDADGRLYVIGGDVEGSIVNTVARYDATTDAWTTLAALPVAVRDACAAVDASGRVCVFGGRNAANTVLTTVQTFDPGSGSWTLKAIPPLPTARAEARAARGADDRLYVVGGVDATGAVTGAVAMHDATIGGWSDIWPLATPRRSFGLALGSDDLLRVMGGIDAAGATLASVETLLTPECPGVLDVTTPIEAWEGTDVALAADAWGAEPLAYAWTRDGEPIVDGPTVWGSEILGSTGPTLEIRRVRNEDAATYAVEVTNDCGSATAIRGTITVRTAIAPPTSWTAEFLHVAGALSSRANAVSNGRVGGAYVIEDATYGALEQAVVWPADDGAPTSLTPGNSVGAGVVDLDGDLAVGWWWWPYQCQVSGQWYTCYSRQAARWDLGTGAFTNLQVSGYEYSSASAVENGVVVGSASSDDASGNAWTHAMAWNLGGWTVRSLHPSNSSSSGAVAIHDGLAVGWRNTPYPAPHPEAYEWLLGVDGSIAGTNLPSPSVATCTATDVKDGLVVGYSGYPYDGARAVAWPVDSTTPIDLHPAGATLSRASLTAGGLVIGTVTDAEGSTLGWWRLADRSFHPLDGLDLDGYTGIEVSDLEVDVDGRFTLVGSAMATAAGRREAIRWHSAASRPADLNGDGLVDAADLALVLAGWGGDGPTDLNGDGTTDSIDIGLILADWGA